MEKKSKTLDDVKKEIRSLLLSSPVGLRLQDLVSDYRAMIGVHLPFQELGYSSATELIRDMPTVVCPKFRAGGVMYLEGLSESFGRIIPNLFFSCIVIKKQQGSTGVRGHQL